MENTFSGSFYFFVFLNSLFLSLLIFLKGKKRKSNLLLAFLLLMFSLHMTEFAGYWTDYLFSIPHLIFLTNDFPLLFGVLIYLYCLLLYKQIRLNKTHLIHFIPFFLLQIYTMQTISLDAQTKISLLNKFILADNPQFGSNFFNIQLFISIHMFTYSYLILRLVNLKSTNWRSLHISQYIAVGFFLYTLLDGIHLIELWLFGYQYIYAVDMTILTFCSILVYSLIYQLLTKSRILNESRLAELKYQKSTLSNSFSDKYLAQLKVAMESDKLYRNPDLNLRMLADHLQISNHQLSQLLNDKLQRNFFDFVNEYRVAYAKLKLARKEQRQFTLESLAFDVGFNTKATFNSAFKKFTGKTPSDYQRHFNS